MRARWLARALEAQPRASGRTRAWGLPLCALLLSSAACGGPYAGDAPARSEDSPIATIHRHKCGACHVRPEPGTRTRQHIEEAFTRHKNRVHLTPDQWSAMVDYLAEPTTTEGAVGAQQRGLK